MKGGVLPCRGGVVEHGFEFGGLEAELADAGEEAALLPDAVDEEAERP